VGLEESDYWSGPDVVKYLGRPEVVKPTTQRDFAELKAKGRRIRHVTSRIMAAVSAQASGWPPAERWRKYHDELLWTPGSGGFQANLYPLGKPSAASWPADFKKLFGFGPEERQRYCDAVAASRFVKLRKLRERCKPLATVCFGKLAWPEFRSVFEVASTPVSHADGKILVHKPERLILTHFFTRAMTNADADRVGSILHQWGVRTP